MIAPKISVAEMIKVATDSKLLCFDVEHESTTKWSLPNFDIHGCGFSSFKDGKIISEYYTSREDIQKILTNCFVGDIEVIAHNASFDLNCLKSAGYVFQDPLIRDTIVLLNLYDENMQSYGLKDVVPEIYGEKMSSYKEASAAGLDTQAFYDYGKDDVYWELRIYLDYRPKVKKKGCWELFTVLMKSLLVFTDISYYGMLWDVDQARPLYIKLLAAKTRIEKSIFKKIGKLNISSPGQLKKRLFYELGYSPKGLVENRNTGKVALDEANLVILSKRYAVCKLIISYRKVAKLISTYIEPLTTEESVSKDGRVHGNFYLHSNTGRTRSSDHNLQNVPTEYSEPELAGINIRKAFVAGKGKKLIVSDYSQLELRLAGHITADKGFMDAYLNYSCPCGAKGAANRILRNCPSCGAKENESGGFWHGQDLHQATTDSIPQMNGDRKAGKVANLAIIYNAKAYRLHTQYPKISQDVWEDIVRGFLRKYSGVDRFLKSVTRSYRAKQPVMSLLGRQRNITDDARKERSEKLNLNQLNNFPGQAAGAIIIQLAQIKLRNRWKKKGWWIDKAMIINSIHDEIVIEADLDILDEAKEDVRECMENCITLKVPLRADPVIASSWGDAK